MLVAISLMVGVQSDTQKIQLMIDKAIQQKKTEVVLKSGVYRLDGPLKISNTSGMTLRAATPGKVVLSGATVISGFKVQNGRWITNLAPNMGYEQLFVNGERRLRPRWPKKGYSHIEKRIDPVEENKGKGSDGYVFKEGSYKKNWTNLNDILVVNFLEWSVANARIRSLDWNSRVVRFAIPTGINDSWSKYKETYRFYVENIKEELSEPGEWYYDQPTGQLSYIPKPGEDLKKVKVELPIASSLLKIDSSSDVKIEGIKFASTSYKTPKEGRFFYQAEADLMAAVQIENSSSCSIKNCEISGTGDYGVKISSNSSKIKIEGNRLTDLGAGGVLLGEMGKSDQPTRECVVKNNVIYGFGRVHPAGIGIWVGQNPKNIVANNWIENGYYSGISVGWSWGYAESGSYQNQFLNNDIHDIDHRVLSDMGGIYSLSPSPGTVISGNRISDINSYGYGGWGIYTDEGSTNIVIKDNVTYRTNSSGFHQHYGKNNLLKNNVFAFGREAQIMLTRAEPHQSFRAESNIFVSDGGPFLGNYGWNSGKYEFQDNVWIRLDGAQAKWGDMDQNAWIAKSGDTPIVMNRLPFMDATTGDFRLKESSFKGFLEHERLTPAKRPSGLPKSLAPTFPIPTEFYPSIWQ